MPDGIAPLARVRALAWLLNSSSVSMLGSRLTTIAYPMLILCLHGSPAVAGLAVFAANAPSFLVYLPAGALVDRWDPRRTLLVAEAGRGVAIGFIVGLLFLHWVTVPLVIAAAILEESLEVISMLAERRYVCLLVDSRDVPFALVSIETRAHAVLTVGRALGGMLFGISQVLPFLADMLSFAASVGSLLCIKSGRADERARARSSKLAAEVHDGLKALLSDRFARDASLVSAYMTLLTQALIIVFLAEAHTRQVSSAVIGAVLATSGIGGVLGALAAKSIRRRARHSSQLVQPVALLAVLAVLALLEALGHWQVPGMAAAMAVLGFSGALSNVELDSHLFAHVPAEKQARVGSIRMLLDFAACALGPAFGGAITQVIGTRGALWTLFTLTIPCVLLGGRFLSVARRQSVPSRTTNLTARHSSMAR